MELSHLSETARRDYKLVVAARELGDQRAYADLMGFYREPIYLMLLRMTHSPVDADDLTIETFGKAFRQLNTYSPKNSFATWLFTIASNRGLDFIRRQHAEVVSISTLSVANNDETYEFPIPSEDENPEEAMIGRQRENLVRQVVAQLPPRYRKIITMRYYEEKSYDEMAKELHVPLGTLKVQMHRARQLLVQIAQNHKHSL